MGDADLTALAVRAGPRFVQLLQREWDRGAAVCPIDARLGAAEANRVLDALAPTHLIDDERGFRRRRAGGRPVLDGDAVVVATSGTSGFPKGVVLTHDAVTASARRTSDRLSIDPAVDRWLCCLPVGHIGGLSVILRAVRTATPLTVHDGFDPSAVRAAARADGVTRVSLVTRALAQVDPAAFTTVLLGGAAAPPDRPANVVATYGSTETGSGIVYDGWPLDGVELRVDAGGQLWVRSPTLLRCYRDGADPKTEDGWFPTGDAARIQPDGRLHVHGRMAEVIVTGGEKVWPARVEPVIAALPGVGGVLVVGEAHPEWGQEVVARIEAGPGFAAPTLDEVKAAVRAELPAWWAPRRLEYVERLPRTPLGKIKRPPPGGATGQNA